LTSQKQKLIHKILPSSKQSVGKMEKIKAERKPVANWTRELKVLEVISSNFILQ
jgi:hypothetical protein